jgi:hypothetical protein
MYKALSTAALGIALSLSLAAPTTASPAPTQRTEQLQLEPPAAPSRVRAWSLRVADPEWPRGYYLVHGASWQDNSDNEDGFIFETWRRQSGDWVLESSVVLPANTTSVEVGGSGQGYRYRVKAFNAAGESDWSNWGR